MIMKTPIADALLSLRPTAAWALHDEDLSTLDWRDETQTRPTDEEIAAEVERLATATPKVTTVTPRQARLALLEAGLLDTIETKLRGKNKAIQIAWDYATEINRDDPLITAIAQELNLTDAAIDLLFKNAASK